VTLLTDKKYRSTAIIYPGNTYLRDEVISNPQFGTERESEQLMQMLESESIRDSVVKKFDLVNYYELDTNSIDWRERLTLKYIRDINCFKSKYMSIVISATTTKPELSAEIVNYITDVIDQYRESIFYENMHLELSYLQENYDHCL